MNYEAFNDQFCFLEEQIETIEKRLKEEEIAPVIRKQMRKQQKDFKQQKVHILQNFAKAFPKTFVEAGKMPEDGFKSLLKVLNKNSHLYEGIEKRFIFLFRDICLSAKAGNFLREDVPLMAVDYSHKKMCRYMYKYAEDNIEFAEWLYKYDFGSLLVKVALKNLRNCLHEIHWNNSHSSVAQQKVIISR